MYLARWNGARVRAKVLHNFGAENLRYESRMAGLCHPNLVSVFGVTSHPEGPMLLMDHAETASLRVWMADNVSPPWSMPALRVRALHHINRCLNIALQIASGMAYLHSNRIVHRYGHRPAISNGPGFRSLDPLPRFGCLSLDMCLNV